jgi:hypothetical protein
MKSLVLIFSILSFSIFFSCGEKKEEIQEGVKAITQAPDIAKNIETEQKYLDAKREERQKRGDTLAMSYKQLQQYLPSSVDSYTAEAPEGESVTAMGGSFSSAERRFVKQIGDEQADVQVSLFDYNSVYGIYSGAVAVWGMGYSVENDRELSKTFNPGIEGSAGFEHLDKENKNAEVTYALGGRFILTVKASNQENTDFVKKVAQSMKLNELAQK